MTAEFHDISSRLTLEKEANRFRFSPFYWARFVASDKLVEITKAALFFSFI